jgi:flagellar biosynthetic protein FliR
MSEFIYLVEQFPLYILVLIRTMGVLGFSPIFSHQAIPMQVKVSLSALVALVILPAIPAEVLQSVVLPDTILGWMFLAAREMLVGLLLGFVTSMAMTGILSAGEFAARDMGMTAASEFNPDVEMPTTPLTELFIVMSSLFLLALNVHHWFLEALLRTYQLIPINHLNLGPDLMQKLIDLMSWVYIIGVRIAAPVMAVMFLLSAAIGVMSRAAPQVNILLISFPIRLAVGLCMVGLSIQFLGEGFKDVLLRMGEEMQILMRLMA